VTIRHAALASYKAAADFIGKGAFFLVLLVAARALPPAEFGLFSLASTLGWILAVATDFGMSLYVAREIAAAPHAMASILAPVLRLRVLVTSGAAALTGIGAWLLLPPNAAVSFTGIVCAYLASGVVELYNYVYRARGRSDIESTLTLAHRFTALALVWFFLRDAPALSTLALALLVPAGMAAALCVPLARRLGADDDTREPVFSKRTFMTDVFPLGLGIVLSSLYFRIDLFLLEHWRGLSEVGSYNAVFRLVEALRLFPGAILAVLLPAVFDRPTGAFIMKMSCGLALLGAAMAAALFPFAPAILELAYGVRYADAATPFRVLLLAFPLLALNYGLTHAVIGWHGQKAFAAGCGAALVANVAMNVGAIPPLGATGAALATLATEALLTIVWMYVLMRRSARDAVDVPTSR
jgi:O-antigen/teichoic acid export membrane protein